jgi:hypothetical protein
MPLIWKVLEEGIQGSTRSFQSKETVLGIGGSLLKESEMFPCSEGARIENLRTRSKYATPPKRRVGLTKDCIINVTSLDLSLFKIREGLVEDCIGVTTYSTIGLIGCETTRSRDASPQKIGVVLVG